jgi:hypothetical protein
MSKIPRAGAGRFQGDGCRLLVGKLARGRLFADLIARQAVNAEPEIRRGPESDDPNLFNLVNAATGEAFTVRFSGDLREYLERRAQEAAASSDANAPAETEPEESGNA